MTTIDNQFENTIEFNSAVLLCTIHTRQCTWTTYTEHFEQSNHVAYEVCIVG